MIDDDQIVPYIGYLSDKEFMNVISNHLKFTFHKHKTTQVTLWSGKKSVRTGFYHKASTLISCVEKYANSNPDIVKCDGIIISHRCDDESLFDLTKYTRRDVSKTTVFMEIERAEQSKDSIIRIYTNKCRLHVEYCPRLSDGRNMKIRSYIATSNPNMYTAIISLRHDPVRTALDDSLVSLIRTYKCTNEHMPSSYRGMELISMSDYKLKKAATGSCETSMYIKSALMNKSDFNGTVSGKISHISNSSEMLKKILGNNYAISVRSIGIEDDDLFEIRSFHKNNPVECGLWIEREIVKYYEGKDVSLIIHSICSLIHKISNDRTVRFQCDCMSVDGDKGRADIVIGDFEEIIEVKVSSSVIGNTDHLYQAIKYSQYCTKKVHVLNVWRNKIATLALPYHDQKASQE